MKSFQIETGVWSKKVFSPGIFSSAEIYVKKKFEQLAMSKMCIFMNKKESLCFHSDRKLDVTLHLS